MFKLTAFLTTIIYSKLAYAADVAEAAEAAASTGDIPPATAALLVVVGLALVYQRRDKLVGPFLRGAAVTFLLMTLYIFFGHINIETTLGMCYMGLWALVGFFCFYHLAVKGTNPEENNRLFPKDAQFEKDLQTVFGGRPSEPKQKKED